MRRYLPLFIVVAIGLSALGGGVFLYQKTKPVALTKSSEAGENTSSLHVRGPANAPVTLEEFGDYQCPPCGTLAEPLNELEREFSPNLKLIYRNFPLPAHSHAREAAVAAEAAGMQGKFWEMHDLLYRQQAVWSKTVIARGLFESYAGLLGLDLNRFKKDMDSNEAQAKVNTDQAQGTALGVRNTPTVFLDKQEVNPSSLNPVALREQIQSALKAKKPPS